MLRFDTKLEQTVSVGGVPVTTDFRRWMRFGQSISPDAVSGEVWGILSDKPMPDTMWVGDALEFWADRVPCPHGGGGHKTLDYDADADYIYAAFVQAYGIDLMTADLHWWTFLALMRGLPDSTLISQVQGYRSWRRQSDSEKTMRKLRDAWSLPEKDSEKDEFLAWQQSAFYGC